jgi:MraZ protein
MFLGTFTPKLDEKSRLIFPAKFRDELASGLVMTRGQEHCIAVYPLMEFRQKLEPSSARSTGSRSGRSRPGRPTSSRRRRASPRPPRR